jgi:hypothetical protein
MWRMASTGFETLREVVVRSSQTGRLRVDLALLGRERQQLLAELGQKVAHLLEADALEVPEEVRVIWERLRDVEGRIQADSVNLHDNAFGASRGYEPEAGSFAGDHDGDGLPDDGELDEHGLPDDGELDEHAEMTESKSVKKGETR